MQKRMKRLIITNGIVLIASILFVIISGILSRNNMWKCMTVEVYSLYCPGCGGTRALFSLLKLDLLSMLKYNPILPMAIFVYAYYNVRAFIEIKRNNEQYFAKIKYRLIYVVIALGFIYFLVRNILLLNGIDLLGDILGGN